MMSRVIGLWSGRRNDRRAASKRRQRTLARIEGLERRELLTAFGLSTQSWTAVGPAGIADGGSGSSAVAQNMAGRTTGVAAHPTDPDTIFVATAGGGVWRTTDGGNDWTPLTDDLPSLYMGAIAISESDPNVLYAGSGEASNSLLSFYGRGVYKTIDGGDSWTVVGPPEMDRRAVSSIDIDPTDPDTVYVAVADAAINGLSGNTGVYKSTDGGVSWTNTTASISSTADWTDVDIDPSDPQVVYAVAGEIFGDQANGIYKSTNGGGSWALAGDATSGDAFGRTKLDISESDPNVLYAAIIGTGRGGSGTFASLFQMVRSADAGVTWTVLSNTPEFAAPQGWYDLTIAVDPDDPNTVYAAGSAGDGSVIGTNDGGQNWTAIAAGPDGSGPHVDHHGMTFDASGNLLNTNDGGIWRLDDPSLSAVSWSNLNGDLQIGQFIGISVDPTDPGRIYGGTQDNGTNSTNGEQRWSQIQFGDGNRTGIDHENPTTIYASFQYIPGIFFRRSDDRGATFTTKTTGINTGDPGNFYIPYIVDPGNASRLLLGTNSLYETTDRADNWAPIATPNTNGWNTAAVINAVATAKTDSNTVYAAAGAFLFATTDNGATWVDRSIQSASDGGIVDIEVDPTNSQIVYAVREAFNSGANQGHVFRSDDGGASWTDISDGLPDVPTFTIALDVNEATGVTNRLFVGSDLGVWASEDLGATWSRFRQGLPNVGVRDLVFSPAQNVLTAGTHGRGVWQIDGAQPLDLVVGTLPGGFEGTPLNNITVATLSDPTGFLDPNQVTLQINWGDQTAPSAGLLVDRGNGNFAVLGSHTYAEGSTQPFTVTVELSRNGQIEATDDGTILIRSFELLAGGGATIRATEDVSVSATVATFLDLDPQAPPATAYTALIEWGDGSQSDGIVTGSDGSYQVQGDHIYQEGFLQPRQIRVTITEPGGNQAVVLGTAVISSLPISALGAALISRQEGANFVGTVATIVDQDTTSSATNYTATINWGDGTTSDGRIVAQGGGRFLVQGDHVFSLLADGSGDLDVRVSVSERGGNQATATTPALITDAPISADGLDFSGVEGVFTGVVARVIDSNPNGSAAELRARINWGDGTTSNGTIRPGAEGSFEVVGTHQYAFGIYPVRVEITSLGGSTATADSNALISDAPITARGLPVVAVEGAFVGRVATFVDQNPEGQASEYSATVDWGDGTTSPATIVAAGDATFSVVAAHSYVVGTYSLVVTIVSVSGRRFTTSNTATIGDAPISSAPVPIQTVEVATSTLAIGAVFDSNVNGTASELSAQIDWGDGTTSAGVISAAPNGGFVLLGTHQYLESGIYPVVATVTSVGGATTVISTTAQVDVLVIPVSGGLVGGTPATNDTTPTFAGFAAPGSTVNLTAIGPLGTELVLGSTVADTTGAWNLTTGGLSDGNYQILASATNTAGRPSSPTVLLNPDQPILVDTTGPFVRDAFLDARRGQVRYLIGDAGSGLSPESLGALSNFGLSMLKGAALPITRVDLLSPNPDGTQTVVATIGRGRPLRRGAYVITVNGDGVRDRAGNALTESFFTPFPQLGNQASSLYLAQIGTNGRGSTAPMQFVPPSELRAAGLFRRFVGAGFRRRPVQ